MAVAALANHPSDLSERADGPSLIVMWGEDDPGLEFRLGTREYD